MMLKSVWQTTGCEHQFLPGPLGVQPEMLSLLGWLTHSVMTRSDDTGGRGSGKVSALCQAALRKRTDGHAMNQGVSLEQARLWPLPCVFFSFLSLIFFGTLT